MSKVKALFLVLIVIVCIFLLLQCSVIWFSFDQENNYFTTIFIMLFNVDVVSQLFNIKGLKSFDSQKYSRTLNWFKICYILFAVHYFIYNQDWSSNFARTLFYKLEISNVKNSFWHLGASAIIWVIILSPLIIFIRLIVSEKIDYEQKIKNAIIWSFNESISSQKLYGVYIERECEERLSKIIGSLKEKLKLNELYKISDNQIEIVVIQQNKFLVNLFLKSEKEFIITDYVAPFEITFNDKENVSHIKLLSNVRKA